MSVDVVYAAAVMAAGLLLAADALITRYGLWVYKLQESNPLYKILPAAVQNFIFGTAFGTFLDAGVKLIGTGVIGSILARHGFYSYFGAVPFEVIAGGSAIITIRNLFLLKAAKAAATKAVVVAPAAK
jgi:hypothetical protein